MSKLALRPNNRLKPVIIAPTKFIKEPTRAVVCELGEDPVAAIVGFKLTSDTPFWVATVNLIDLPPREGCVWINNNGRNRGLQEELIRHGVIKFNDRFAFSKGIGYIFECKIMI